MPRLPALDPSTTTGKAHELLQAVQSKLGITPNMMRTMANSPAVLQGYLSFSSALGEGALPAKLREQLALAVAQANGCDYCMAAHGTLGKLAGLSPQEISASLRSTASDPKAEAALRFAVALVERRGAATNEDFARVRAAGFGDGEIAEIVAHVALNVLTNYFNTAAQVTVDFPPVERAA